MAIKIITDTSSDITFEEQKKYNIDMIPFIMNVAGQTFIDNNDLDFEVLRETLANAPKKASNGESILSTSCPPPAEFLEAYERNANDDIIVLTISNILSGSYNSANLAKDMYLEKYPNNKIYIVNTISDAAGPAMITYKLLEILDNGASFEEAIEQIEKYKYEIETFVILERLDNVIKTGRLSKTKGFIANTLNIKPLMVGDNGELVIYKQLRGIKKAIDALVDRINELSETEGKKILISHSEGMHNVDYLTKLLNEKCKFREVIIRKSRGISFCYCDIGGMVISFEK